MTPRRPFEIMAALKFGFNALGNNFLRVVGVYLRAIGAFIGIGGIFALFSLIIAWLIHADANVLLIEIMSFATITSFFILFVVGFSIKFVVGMALDRVALDAYDKKKTKFRALLPLLGSYVMAIALSGLLTIFGLLLIVIPGVIWFIKYNFADFVVIDTRMGAIDALKRSGQLTYGHKWYLAGVFLLAIILLSISIITIIGPFVLMYVYTFSRAYIYRKLVESHDKDRA